MVRRRISGWGRRLGAILLGAAAVYLLAANVLLRSGLIERALGTNPNSTAMSWSWALSPWPGRVYLSGFRLRVDDSAVQFKLELDSAVVDVDLLALLRRTFRASRVRAEGVRFRLLTTVESAAGQERRLAAFPHIDGFARPALRPKKEAPERTPAELAKLWTVELDDVDGNARELWFLEYHYEGPARVRGGFALALVRRLWVGPAQVELAGGRLSVGDHLLSRAFTAQLAATIAPTELASSPGMLLLRTLDGSICFDTRLEGLGAADLYRDGLRVRGEGRVAADLRFSSGRLAARSSLEVWLSPARVQLAGATFSGEAQAHLSVGKGAAAPIVRAKLAGRLDLPLFEHEIVVAGLSGVTAELALADGDLVGGLALSRLDAALGEVRVADARAITRRIAATVPIIAPLVLGDGPLVAVAHATVTPGAALVRLERLELGAARIAGAALHGQGGWNGAAGGRFGPVRLGLRLQKGKVKAVPLASPAWLREELQKAHIPSG